MDSNADRRGGGCAREAESLSTVLSLDDFSLVIQCSERVTRTLTMQISEGFFGSVRIRLPNCWGYFIVPFSASPLWLPGHQRHHSSWAVPLGQGATCVPSNARGPRPNAQLMVSFQVCRFREKGQLGSAPSLLKALMNGQCFT